jgi:hypothetical protein
VNYKVLTLLAFMVAVVLRVLLWWANPATNAFDDHFEPILLIMRSGKIPAKDACWQCYHPPVFYLISAAIGRVAVAFRADFSQLLKVLQFIPCLYGILTVGVVHLILRKLPLTEFSRFLAFGVVCVLPRHVYMSAMHSNDTISYLFVALSIYLLLIAMGKGLSPWILLATSAVVAMTIFTKYTAFALLPAILVVFVQLFHGRLLASRRRVVVSAMMVLLVPLVLLGAYLRSNTTRYGTPLPWNVDQLDPSKTQPRDDEPMNYFSFKPWETVAGPIIAPGKMHSFWTLLYTGLWFDNEPRFLLHMDSNRPWWKHYYAWLRGEEPYPGDNPSVSRLTGFSGAGLVALGLVPLLLVVVGFVVCCRRMWSAWRGVGGLAGVEMSIFPALFAFNAAGIVLLTVRLPVFSAAKASYILISLPAFAVFLSLGLMSCENRKRMRWTAMGALGLLFALSCVHIVHIAHIVSASS